MSLAEDQFANALSAYFDEDEEQAQMVMKGDEPVNAMFTKCVNGVAKVISDQPTDAMAAVDTMMIAKIHRAHWRPCHQHCGMGHVFGHRPPPQRKRCWMKTEQTKCAATLAAHFFVKLYSIERREADGDSASMPGRQRQRLTQADFIEWLCATLVGGPRRDFC